MSLVLAMKNALVTGANRGIGLELVKQLLDSGFKVHATFRSAKGGLEAITNPNLSIHQMDIRDKDEIEKVIDSINSLDLLINNAGVGTKRPMEVQSYNTADWDRIVNTNLKGSFFSAREALRSMQEKRLGTIINIVSITGIKAAPNVLPYSVSKFGMMALGQTLLAENLKLGIKIHNICPGTTNTSIWDKKEKPVSEAKRKKMLKPEDIASVAEFLLTLPKNVRIDEVVVLPNYFPVELWDYAILEDSDSESRDE